MSTKFKKIKEFLAKISPPVYIIKTARTDGGVDGRVVSYSDPHSNIAEQYRSLRTNLYSLSAENPIKTILLTSTQPEEGKTVTVCNMAFAISKTASKKTILVDADLRKPKIHKMFSLERKPGFSDIVTGSVDIEKFLKKPTIENLYVVPSGSLKSNFLEILDPAKIKGFIEKLKLKFDYIIFDAPPTLNVTDAAVLGAMCDAVILVVKAGVTQKSAIEDAFNILRSAQAKPKACILTNFTIPAYYYYAKYRYYYRYPYQVKDEPKKSAA